MGQQLKMTPQLLQSIRLLQLTSLELEQEVRQALDENPMLESEDDEPGCHECAAETAATPESFESGGSPEALSATDAPVTGCDAAASERVEADFDWSSSESWSAGEPPAEEMSFESRHAEAPSENPRTRALAQLALVVRDEREAAIVAAIVDSVDDNGYLEQPLDAIRAHLPDELQVTEAEMEAALEVVHGVEPTGFAARNLSECLSLQLQALDAGIAAHALALRVARHHLHDLATLNTAALAQRLDCSQADLKTALTLIRGLDPKPGAAALAPAQAVVPDLIVTGDRHGWKVELNPATLPRVRVNSLYERQLNAAGGTSGGGYKALRERLLEARWLVRGLEMRHETLLKTARVVFRRQCRFLNCGEEGLMPLTLREVAAEIAMHESTVCRVVSNKYVQTPWGVYPLKALFPSQIAAAEGETSGTAVRAMIRRIIEAENRATPLCDGDVVALLARRGVRVARRTVAKYREAMKIAPAAVRAQPLRATG